MLYTPRLIPTADSSMSSVVRSRLTPMITSAKFLFSSESQDSNYSNLIHYSKKKEKDLMDIPATTADRLNGASWRRYLLGLLLVAATTYLICISSLPGVSSRAV